MKSKLNRCETLASPFGGGSRGRIFSSLRKLSFLGLILIFTSCRNSKLNYDLVRKKFTQFIVEKNESALKKSYQLLLMNSDFNKNGLTKNNLNIVFPILIKMKKYDELLILVRNSNNVMTDYHKEFHTNYLIVLKNRCDNKEISNHYTYKNLEFVKSEIKKNPNDSTKVFDYLSFKAYFVNKQIAINEVDSIKNKSSFSNFFYENVILQSILEIDTTEFICK